ncbi:MAG: exodeoxyribonuclease VII large subunit [Roseitalea porphyridii]
MAEPSNSPESDAAGNQPEYSVSELSRALKQVVEGRFESVRVRGEISGFKRAVSGHLYMSLKDDAAVIDAVCWRGTASGLRFKPEDGLEVVASGRLTTYAQRSRYQIVIEHLAPAGVGALMALLEQRRKQLAAEGLFEADRKRPLPYLPAVIGVVTSPTGAVIRDILHRLADRFPRRVLVWPVLVQGEGAAAQVANAIQGFNALAADGPVPRPDLLIVARGGGSIEDLWAFNEEIVVRAAAASEIPLISAVGHETDTTLIDLASDRRAPTPTAAAEMAVPVRADLAMQLRDFERRQAAALQRLIAERRQALVALVRGLRSAPEPLLQGQQRLDDLSERLGLARRNLLQRQADRLDGLGKRLRKPEDVLRFAERHLDELTRALQRTGWQRLATAEERLAGSGRLLESLSYRRVLARGYAVVRGEDRAPVTDAAGARAGMRLAIEFRDGEVAAVAEGGGAKPVRASRPRKKPTPGTQEELF